MIQEMCSTYSTQIWKDEIIQTPQVVAIKKLQEPPTWLKVTTTLESLQPPPIYIESFIPND